ncbi:MAG: putative porin [Cyclobacteriaceae bacterium]|nr:putative porin [Cyclobacteriaceae bacterium]
MFLRISSLILFAVLLCTSAKAQRRGSQVVDDSTRNVYGPHTTKWITEEDLFYDRNNYQPVDTSIHNYHRWNYVNRLNNTYKDLGNIGTPLFPIFPVLEGSIGVSTGFRVYDQYFLTEEPKYFDTKSPYTRMRIIWGGQGRAMTRIEFSRNVNERWNFGFNYRPILVDKQILRANKGDRQTISHYYDAYTAYRSENNKYQLLFNYRRIRHSVVEMGGVNIVETAADSTYQSLFDPNITPKLTAASSVQLQNQAHLFHQYRIGNGLQLYHQSDLGKKVNTYKDNLNTDPAAYYDNKENVNDTPNDVSDSTRFSYWTNELGVKGKIGSVFYNGYLKSRAYKFRYKYITEDTLDIPLTDDEYYIGGRLSYEHDSLTHITAWLEYLDGGNYRAEATLKSRWIDAKAIQLLSKPPFIYNAYRGSFDLWNNSFRNTFSTQLEAFGKLQLGRIFVSPGFRYTSLRDYIYFKEDNYVGTSQTVLPVQSSGKQELLSPELRFEVKFFRNMYLRPQVIYSTFLVNDDNALRVPELFVNTQLAYENQWFNNNLEVQIGIDFHWQSAYYDFGYDPAMQQYYAQDEVKSPAFPLTDIFLNGKMKRGRFFFKYSNLVQAFTQEGYLSTPVYPGQRNIFDFGFELLLFD